MLFERSLFILPRIDDQVFQNFLLVLRETTDTFGSGKGEGKRHFSSYFECAALWARRRKYIHSYTRVWTFLQKNKNKKKKGRKSEKKKEKIETENPIKIIDSMFAEGCLRVEDEIWKIGTAKRKSASHYRAFLVAHNISLAFFFFSSGRISAEKRESINCGFEPAQRRYLLSG